MAKVWRCVFDVEDVGDAGEERGQPGGDRKSLRGNRHCGLCANQGVYGGAVSEVVPVRGVLAVVSRTWAHVEAAASVGLEHRGLRAWGDGSECCVLSAK